MFRPLLLAFLITLGLPLAAQDSEEFRFGDDAFLAGQTVTHADGSIDDLFAAGDWVTASAEVTGSAHMVGRNVTVSGGVGENLYAAGRNVTLSSAVTGDAIMMGETIIISADIGGDLRAAGRSIDLSAGVADAALLAGERVTINGVIAGDLGVAADQLEFGPEARVTGSLHIYSDDPETVEVPASVATPDQIVLHQSQEWKGIHADTEMHAAPESAWQKFRGMVGSILVITVLTAIFAAIAPNVISDLRERALAAPLRTGVVGFIALAATIGSLVLFAMTGFGLLLVPVSIIAALLLALAGYLIGTYVLGVAITGILGREAPSDLGDRAIAALVGAIAVAVIGLIPFIGWLFVLVLGWVGAGALIARWFAPGLYVADE